MYPYQNYNSLQNQANNLASMVEQLRQTATPYIPQMPVDIPRINYVRGVDGAREYLNKMPANGMAILMDQDEAKFYVVSKDANGNPAPIAFATFTLQTEDKLGEPSYITKKDFDDFKEEIRSLVRGDQK